MGLEQHNAQKWVNNVIAAWVARFPKEAAAFKDMLKKEANALLSPNGMSKNRTIQYRGQIPHDVYLVIVARYPDFFKKKANLRYLQEEILGGCGIKKSKNFHEIRRR